MRDFWFSRRSDRLLARVIEMFGLSIEQADGSRPMTPTEYREAFFARPHP